MRKNLFVAVFVLMFSAMLPAIATAQIIVNSGSGGGYGNYSSGYGGYDYGYGFHQTGIKFNTDRVAKEDRTAVKDAVVTVDGNEIGLVDEHDGFWNGILALPPGPHEIIIELQDGSDRNFTTSISLIPGRIIRVRPRFPSLSKKSSSK